MTIAPFLGALALCAAAAAAFPAPASAQDAATLKARHAALGPRLADNAFGRPLVLDSKETSGDLRGDVYSVVEHPYPVVLQSLRSVDTWCDVLLLHLNVKGCKATPGANASLTLNVGRKFDQTLEEAYALEFAFKPVAATSEYLQVQLTAPEGPLSTKNYRIVVEAVPLDARKTFVHMSYAYGYGFTAKVAMQTYLATVGRDKVGFSTAERPEGGSAQIGGVLGLLERNTMRYYLAIDAYLSAHAAPKAEQAERRLKAWFAATERYARQLREMGEAEYMDMKRKELKRSQDGAAAEKKPA
jgi:hypothetical protein